MHLPRESGGGGPPEGLEGGPARGAVRVVPKRRKNVDLSDIITAYTLVLSPEDRISSIQFRHVSQPVLLRTPHAALAAPPR
jgi:hypothetical protein